jgi:hypothetical protein
VEVGQDPDDTIATPTWVFPIISFKTSSSTSGSTGGLPGPGVLGWVHFWATRR